MPHTGSNRQHGSFGRRLARFLTYMKARRLCSEISRDMAFFEMRFLKSRHHHS